MLGNTEDAATLDIGLTFVNVDRASGLAPGKTALLRAWRIPNSGPNPLETPPLIVEKRVPIEDNRVRVLLPGIGPGDACTVRLATAE